MAESVPVRCPVCRREHSYTPAVYPCPCGAPVSLPLRPGGVPVQLRTRTWDDSWVEACCPSCGRCDQWPQPEFGCPCGAMVRLPVITPPPAPAAQPTEPPGTSGPQTPARPAFRPVTIRTARDAVTAAEQYLLWLGFTEINVAHNPDSGVHLRGARVVAQVDPTTAPTALRDIETLWLNGLNESVIAVCFSLAGYSKEARGRADELEMPLFVLDLTGTPQPVNDPADQLIRRGAEDS